MGRNPSPAQTHTFVLVPSQPKISQSDITVVGDQDIRRFDISVKDFVLVAKIQPPKDLAHVVLDLTLLSKGPSAEVKHQSTSIRFHRVLLVENRSQNTHRPHCNFAFHQSFEIVVTKLEDHVHESISIDSMRCDRGRKSEKINFSDSVRVEFPESPSTFMAMRRSHIIEADDVVLSRMWVVWSSCSIESFEYLDLPNRRDGELGGTTGSQILHESTVPNLKPSTGYRNQDRPLLAGSVLFV